MSQQTTTKEMPSEWKGWCRTCKGEIKKGEIIIYDKVKLAPHHKACFKPTTEPATSEDNSEKNLNKYLEQRQQELKKTAKEYDAEVAEWLKTELGQKFAKRVLEVAIEKRAVEMVCEQLGIPKGPETGMIYNHAVDPTLLKYKQEEADA